MDSMYKKKNLKSLKNEITSKPIIELVKYNRDAKGVISVHENEIVFFLDGKIHLEFNNLPEYTVDECEVVLIPRGETIFYTALTDCSVVVFRINKSEGYSEIFQSDGLFGVLDSYSEDTRKTKKIHSLKISKFVHLFLDNLWACMNDGLKCIYYFELKTKELFFILKANYTKEEICYLLPFILNKDFKLSEQSSIG